MGAPGTLIPAEAPSGHLQNFGLDARNITTVAAVGRSSCIEPEQGGRVRSSSPCVDTTKTRSTSSEFPPIANESNIQSSGLVEIQSDLFEYDVGNQYVFSTSGESKLDTGKKTGRELLVEVPRYVNHNFFRHFHTMLLRGTCVDIKFS